ncbi:sulfatase-like hydrolase/transferase [Bacteroidota bacterium]
MILTDDQRFNTISALGNNEIETPNFDKLVEQGISFTQAHIMGGSHAAVCMPSRAMLMTGRALFSLEGEGQRIPPEHTTIGEVFRHEGYTTCHVGKWHNDSQSHHRSFTTANKIYGLGYTPFRASNAHWNTPVNDFQPDGNYDNSKYYNDPPHEDFSPPYEITKVNGRHSAEVFTDGAISFLTEQLKQENGKPFFLYLAHLAPHDPRQYPAQLTERYNKDRVSLPANFLTKHPFDNGEMTVRDELLLRSPRFPHEVKEEIADYYGIISHLDSQIGRLLSFLEANGLDKNTIIVLAGDNGLALGQHGLVGKQNVYEHSVRVPLIMNGPEIPKNEIREQYCYLLDIFPTLCDMLDFEIPGSVEGVSLLPCIQDNKVVRKQLFFAYKDVQRSIKEGDYKLIEYVVPNKSMYLPKERRGEFITTTQLFNLKEDPLEMNNLAANPEYHSKLIDLREKLKEYSKDLNDTDEMGETFWTHYEPK